VIKKINLGIKQGEHDLKTKGGKSQEKSHGNALAEFEKIFFGWRKTDC